MVRPAHEMGRTTAPQRAVFASGSDDGKHPRATRRSRRWGRMVWVLSAVSLALLTAGTLVVHHQLLGGVTRLDGAFSGLDYRPVETATGALDILLIGVRRWEAPAGTDGVEPLPWVGGAQLESVLMVHLATDRRSAVVVAIPLSARFADALAGPRASGAVEAVESLTDVRVDHVAVVDWAALEALAADNGAPRLEPAAGSAGARARQQVEFLRHLAEDTLHAEMRKQPWRVYQTLDTVTDGLLLDDEWSSLELTLLGLSLRDLRSGDIDFVVAGDTDGAAWAALRQDRLRQPRELVS